MNRGTWFSCVLVLAWALLLLGTPAPASAQSVPGTGKLIKQIGDDFEAEWEYLFNLPKSSEEQDRQVRPPGGVSKNGRWFEPGKRGQPDVVKRVPTPEGGLPNSTGALLIRSRDTGIPGRPSRTPQQDDFSCDVRSRLGGPLSVSRTPSVVVRVYLPPYDQWEQRTGVSFGFRASLVGTRRDPKSRRQKTDIYWPGMFVYFNAPSAKNKEASAKLLVRGGPTGHDFDGPKMGPGWWTLGMSFTPEGQVHFYARPGVEELTAKDLVSSQFPYGFRCLHMDNFFFNVTSADNGKTWSTPWIVDDARVYIK